ncbi:phospholipase D-like domain-containing protein [Flavobacteriaceae bacterium]|nr:phospholipase D-like domain-containing protein [Flavobacteriaceae bacterium]
MIQSYFQNIRTELLEKLSNANDTIVVAVYWFTNWELFIALIKKLQEGVSVHLIIHNDFINNRESGLPFQEFIDLGGKFYFSDGNNPMHNKFCVIDQKVLINGSYNWTYFAEEKNRENILIIENEREVINSFYEEFQRLVELTTALEKIEPISKFEIGLNDELNQKEYLAKDLLFKASKESNEGLVQQAFDLVPDNIAVQKLADKLDLIKKNKLAYDVGLSIEHDNIKYLAKKGDKVPSVYTTIVRTSRNNQTKSITDIVYGSESKASKNKTLVKIEFNEIPALPKGEAKIKFTFSIDKDGNAIIQQLCLANGKKIIKRIKEIKLIE